MALGDVIEAVERSERTLTVFNPGDDVDTELAELLEDRNVTVTTEQTTSGRPTDFAVLDLDGTVFAAIDLGPLRSLVDGATPTAGGLGFETEGYADVLRHLQEATFTSVDRETMLQATREIEDRAFRVDSGRLQAGFQTTDRLVDERERYVELADRGLEVTVYATPRDRDPEVRVRPSVFPTPTRSHATGSSSSTAAAKPTRSVRCSPRNATASTASGRTIRRSSTGS